MNGTIARATAALLLGAGMLTGCNSKSAPTPENLLAGLDKYFAGHRRDCLFPSGWRFPYTTSDPVEKKQLDTLVKAQLLMQTKEQNLAYYTPTDYGKVSAPLFCYGYRDATSIDSQTPLEVKDGFKQTNVTYHYQMMDVPAWAKSDDLKAVFPKLAKDLSGNATDKAALAQTAVGWQVPD